MCVCVCVCVCACVYMCMCVCGWVLVCVCVGVGVGVCKPKKTYTDVCMYVRTLITTEKDYITERKNAHTKHIRTYSMYIQDVL